MRTIPFALPEIGEEEIQEVIKTLRSGFLTSGPMALRFEDEFKKFIGCRHALSVNSATSGLHLALMVAGIRPGDHVVVPVNTFTATANVICYLGAIPVFCDIDPLTFNIHPGELKKILEADTEKRIKAVMAVHIAGQSADLISLMELKRTFNFILIEDAAHAFPCTHFKKMIGTIGDLTVFSFYPTKTLASIEGGMICTENDQWASRLRILKDSGINRNGPYYDVEELGYKYGMNDVAATIAIHQLAKARRFLERRCEIAEYYNLAFKNNEKISIPHVANDEDIHSRHLYIIKVKNRNELAKKLSEKGIQTSLHFRPLHLHSFWKQSFPHSNSFPFAESVYEQILSLPIYPGLSQSDVEFIAQSVTKLA